MCRLPSPPRNSIFGPWTTVVALHMYCTFDYETSENDNNVFETDFREEYCQWFENVHRILAISFTNLRSVWMQSYSSFFTKKAHHTIGTLVRRNNHLVAITLHTHGEEEPFNLDPLAGNSSNLKHLSICGGRFSDAIQGKPMQGAGFEIFNSLTIKRDFKSFEVDLETLHILSTLSKPRLKSLCIMCGKIGEYLFEEITGRLFTPSQCAVTFSWLCTLCVGGNFDRYNTQSADPWLKWVGPYASGLQDVTRHRICALRSENSRIQSESSLSMYWNRVFHSSIVPEFMYICI